MHFLLELKYVKIGGFSARKVPCNHNTRVGHDIKVLQACVLKNSITSNKPCKPSFLSNENLQANSDKLTFFCIWMLRENFIYAIKWHWTEEDFFQCYLLYIN